MIEIIDISDFFNQYIDWPLIDVRSPGEYEKGHVPQATSIPLFTNDERAHIGTVYKQQGQHKAIDLGYKYVNPKLQWYVDESLEAAPSKKVVVHCWRGGMRSNAFAEHLIKNGFQEVKVVKGGYKAYRNYVLKSFDTPADFKVIGGYTGSGKTRILKVLEEMGEQVIDLEKLANHKGSAFGSIGEMSQPTVEQFENNLFAKWHILDFRKPIFVEDESHNIGRIVIPMNFFNRMTLSKVFFFNIPKEKRAELLVEDYTGFDNQLLENSIHKISKRLGGLNTRLALEALSCNDYHEVALITLGYYDKSYRNVLLRRKAEQIINIDCPDVNPVENAKALMRVLRIQNVNSELSNTNEVN